VGLRSVGLRGGDPTQPPHPTPTPLDSYKWAEVLSADAFAAFEESGLDDAAATQAMGRRFRDTVLALGGSVAPEDVFEMFRGRAPSTEALLRHSGLVGAAA
jgi:oligopeptidase A